MAVGRFYRSAPLARLLLLFSIAGMLARCAVAAEPEQAAAERYVLNYPLAERFCPPTETYFDDVTHENQTIRGKAIRHLLNGGYGPPVLYKMGDHNVLHLGADVAWIQPGAPIHAIADGVVRISQGPPAETTSEPGKSSRPQNAALGWGNVIVIEHHLSGERYVTSIYGHLSNRRLAAVGEIVQAGQVIGFEGRQGVENGGYTPHLHLGIREGRMFQSGVALLSTEHDGKPVSLKLANLTETELEIETDDADLNSLQLTVDGHGYSMTLHDDKRWLPAGILNHLTRPGFAIVGYGRSTEGFLDPTDFLRLVAADVRPAPYIPLAKTAASAPKH